MNELLQIALNTINFYFTNNKIPTENDINLVNKDLLNQRGCVFVTVYINGQIRGSAGNVKEIEQNIVMETIKATVDAISHDSRFSPIAPNESGSVQLRVDFIKERKLLQKGQLAALNPQFSGVIAISKDGTKIGVVLPRISSKLVGGDDFFPILAEKMKIPKFNEDENLIYEMKTEIFSNV